ncbi:MAG: CBS domain-containing protein [Candidatus Latescibacterota bacterium]|nr:MAG: CBS domain-containing protein [Candidatus Latescibacterota bacterium]
MMGFKKAGEFMIPLDEYPHIPYWFTLRETIAELESAEIETRGRTSLPRWVLVFDEKYQLMGTVRRRDILRGLEPEFLVGKPIDVRKGLFNVKVDPELSELSFDKMQDGMRKQAERRVSDVMLPIKATVDFEDHMVKVIYEMVDNNVSMIPVLKDKKVVGVVRSVDLLHEVVKIVL